MSDHNAKVQFVTLQMIRDFIKKFRTLPLNTTNDQKMLENNDRMKEVDTVNRLDLNPVIPKPAPIHKYISKANSKIFKSIVNPLPVNEEIPGLKPNEEFKMDFLNPPSESPFFNADLLENFRSPILQKLGVLINNSDRLLYQFDEITKKRANLVEVIEKSVNQGNLLGTKLQQVVDNLYTFYRDNMPTRFSSEFRDDIKGDGTMLLQKIDNTLISLMTNLNDNKKEMFEISKSQQNVNFEFIKMIGNINERTKDIKQNISVQLPTLDFSQMINSNNQVREDMLNVINELKIKRSNTIESITKPEHSLSLEFLIKDLKDTSFNQFEHHKNLINNLINEDSQFRGLFRNWLSENQRTLIKQEESIDYYKQNAINSNEVLKKISETSKNFLDDWKKAYRKQFEELHLSSSEYLKNLSITLTSNLSNNLRANNEDNLTRLTELFNQMIQNMKQLKEEPVNNQELSNLFRNITDKLIEIHHSNNSSLSDNIKNQILQIQNRLDELRSQSTNTTHLEELAKHINETNNININEAIERLKKEDDEKLSRFGDNLASLITHFNQGPPPPPPGAGAIAIPINEDQNPVFLPTIGELNNDQIDEIENVKNQIPTQAVESQISAYTPSFAPTSVLEKIVNKFAELKKKHVKNEVVLSYREKQISTLINQNEYIDTSVIDEEYDHELINLLYEHNEFILSNLFKYQKFINEEVTRYLSYDNLPDDYIWGLFVKYNAVFTNIFTNIQNEKDRKLFYINFRIDVNHEALYSTDERTLKVFEMLNFNQEYLDSLNNEISIREIGPYNNLSSLPIDISQAAAENKPDSMMPTVLTPRNTVNLNAETQINPITQQTEVKNTLALIKGWEPIQQQNQDPSAATSNLSIEAIASVSLKAIVLQKMIQEFIKKQFLSDAETLELDQMLNSYEFLIPFSEQKNADRMSSNLYVMKQKILEQKIKYQQQTNIDQYPQKEEFNVPAPSSLIEEKTQFSQAKTDEYALLDNSNKIEEKVSQTNPDEKSYLKERIQKKGKSFKKKGKQYLKMFDANVIPQPLNNLIDLTINKQRELSTLEEPLMLPQEETKKEEPKMETNNDDDQQVPEQGKGIRYRNIRNENHQLSHVYKHHKEHLNNHKDLHNKIVKERQLKLFGQGINKEAMKLHNLINNRKSNSSKTNEKPKELSCEICGGNEKHEDFHLAKTGEVMHKKCFEGKGMTRKRKLYNDVKGEDINEKSTNPKVRKMYEDHVHAKTMNQVMGIRLNTVHQDFKKSVPSEHNNLEKIYEGSKEHYIAWGDYDEEMLNIFCYMFAMIENLDEYKLKKYKWLYINFCILKAKILIHFKPEQKDYLNDIKTENFEELKEQIKSNPEILFDLEYE